jgi:uncharacterized protein (TIGR04255 family)
VIRSEVESPFGDEDIEEVPLPRAPLVRVIAQVQFPKILSLDTDAGVAAVQAALRSQYPILQQQQTVGVLITSDGVAAGGQQQTATVWRLQTKAGDWTVSLGSSFVALDTVAYTSRDDFCSRLDEVLDVIGRLVEPIVAERVGLRYTNRVDDPDQFASLAGLVRPEVLGGHSIALPQGVTLQHSLCESIYNFDGGQLLARWGVVPAGAILDPGLSAVDRRSWILDLDVFHVGRVDFEVSDLSATVREFAVRAYRFFRWAVSDEFLHEAGGEQ